MSDLQPPNIDDDGDAKPSASPAAPIHPISPCSHADCPKSGYIKKICGKCFAACHCSRECQLADWKQLKVQSKVNQRFSLCYCIERYKVCLKYYYKAVEVYKRALKGYERSLGNIIAFFHASCSQSSLSPLSNRNR